MKKVITILLFASPGFQVFSQCNHPDDVAALKAIYDALDGDNWVWSNPTHGWDVDCVDCDLSTWSEIVCNSEGRVEKIWLHTVSILGLNGELPPEVGLLTELKNFQIQNDASMLMEINPVYNVYGEIPVEFKNCTKMERFIIHCTNVTGQIPNIFNDMKNLVHLDLSRNQLNQEIPEYFAESISDKNIAAIVLQRNKLTGNFPENFITELPKSVRSINLGHNFLEGELPEGLGSLTHLNYLELWMNNFTGCYPDDMKNLCGNTLVTTVWYSNIFVEGIYDNNDFTIPNFWSFCDGQECIEEPTSKCETKLSFENRLNNQISISNSNGEVIVSLLSGNENDKWFPIWGDNTSGGAGYFWGSGQYPVTHTYSETGVYSVCVSIENHQISEDGNSNLCNCKIICETIQVKN